MDPPSVAVVEAFGADTDAVVPLPGGQGGSWRAGAIVLKPASAHSHARWLGPLLATLPASPRFRLAHPVQANGGAWTVDGWEATSWLVGAHKPSRWADALIASRALHDALREHVPAPPVELARRSDSPWVVGDRVAWGERSAGDAGRAVSEVLGYAGRFIEPEWSGPRPQLIHGDLGLGNIVFADELSLPPAVIDFSPYWRPGGFALAVLVADALAWQDAPGFLALQFMQDEQHGRELLARAVIYRIATGARLWDLASDRFAEEVARYRQVVDVL